MRYKVLIVFFLLIFPIFTNAKDVNVFSDTEKFSNFYFHLKAGEKAQGSILIKNDGEKDLSVEIFFNEKDISENVFSEMKFIADEIPEKYREELEKKENNIIDLCKHYDSDLELNNWCNGVKHPKILLKSKKEKRIDYIISFSDKINKKTENNLQVYSKKVNLSKEGTDEVGEEEYIEKSSIKMVFDPVIDRSVNLKIKTFSLLRNLNTFDFINWIKNGFKETYNAEIIVSNNSENQKDDKIPFTIDLVVQSLKFTNEFKISKNGDIEKNGLKEQDFEGIEVPRFGTVLIGANVKYKNNGKEKIFSTEQVRIFLFPLKELISVSSIIILIWFSRVFWRNRKKFIKHGDKKHEKIDNTVVTEKNLLENYKKNKVNDNVSIEIEKTNFSKISSATLSSENIDIEWMKGGDGYDESLKKQEKKLNRGIALILFMLIVIILFFIFISFKSEPKKINLNNDKDVSIEDLITKDIIAEEEISQELIDDKVDGSIDIEEKEKKEEKNVTKKIDNSDILIQVLNGGSPDGSAGKAVDYLDKKGYKVNKADNAENEILDIVVYFSGDSNSRAKQVLESIIQFRQGYEGKVKYSKELIEKYNTDVVVVLGTPNDKILNKVKINSIKKNSKKIEILDGGEAFENINKISDILKKESYEVNFQKKSNNKYKITTIYFKSGDENTANKIHKMIEGSVDMVIKEEYSKLVNKYNSDIVIVVSK